MTKYLMAFAAAAAVIVTAILALLGIRYGFEGIGLHPVLAAAGAICCVVAGFAAASIAADQELEEDL